MCMHVWSGCGLPHPPPTLLEGQEVHPCFSPPPPSSSPIPRIALTCKRQQPPHPSYLSETGCVCVCVCKKKKRKVQGVDSCVCRHTAGALGEERRKGGGRGPGSFFTPTSLSLSLCLLPRRKRAGGEVVVEEEEEEEEEEGGGTADAIMHEEEEEEKSSSLSPAT